MSLATQMNRNAVGTACYVNVPCIAVELRPTESLCLGMQLWLIADKLLRSVDSSFEYSNIAVSKNFVGSPHVDSSDISYQYALSVGDFSAGGELCVEVCPRTVAVITTKDRIARVDGRFPHWVRSYTGERFSVIWYKTHGTPTPCTDAVLETI
eukprot:m.1364155 g.1364155  ORF g.1364155 m.1364155 type:complete len:153 (+) comp24946_c0_seq36:1849-2307(+)